MNTSFSIAALGDSVRNTLNEISRNIGKGSGALDTAVDRSARVGQIWNNEREKIMPVMNAAVNTIDADLKRVLILQETVRAFATRVIPLRLFANSFGNVPLQGTDEVAVSYLTLQAAARHSFSGGCPDGFAQSWVERKGLPIAAGFAANVVALCGE